MFRFCATGYIYSGEIKIEISQLQTPQGAA